MIWIIIGFLAGIILGILFSDYLNDSFVSKILDALWLIPIAEFVALPFGLITAFSFGCLGTAILPSEEIVISENAICSISDSISSDDDFVLGIGHTYEGMYFCYIAETPQGKRAETVKAEHTTIIKSNSQTPNVVVKSERYKWEWLNFLFLDVRIIFDDLDETILTVPRIRPYSNTVLI